MERVSMERRIKSRVKDQMDKNQREYYLSEQIKAINKEMGREDDPQAEIAELEQMLKAKNMPEEAREKGMSELKKLRMMARPPPNTPSSATMWTGFWNCRGMTCGKPASTFPRPAPSSTPTISA